MLHGDRWRQIQVEAVLVVTKILTQFLTQKDRVAPVPGLYPRPHLLPTSLNTSVLMYAGTLSTDARESVLQPGPTARSVCRTSA
jgi:hypothetical protein